VCIPLVQLVHTHTHAHTHTHTHIHTHIRSHTHTGRAWRLGSGGLRRALTAVSSISDGLGLWGSVHDGEHADGLAHHSAPNLLQHDACAAPTGPPHLDGWHLQAGDGSQGPQCCGVVGGVVCGDVPATTQGICASGDCAVPDEGSGRRFGGDGAVFRGGGGGGDGWVGGRGCGISGASFERGGSQELFSGSVKGVGLQPDEEMCRTTGMHGEVVGSNTTDSSQDCLQLLHRDPRFICAMALL